MPLVRLAAAIAVVTLAAAAPARAAFVITPTFDSSMTVDPNFVAIRGAINSAIAVYEANFTDNINVNITFGEMSSGLGQSSKTLYNLTYAAFRVALAADSKSSDDASALTNSVPAGTNNPVTNNTNILVSTANIKALGIAGSFPSILACGATCDGFIQLNTSLTTPGSAGTTSQYNLQVVAEHEIDEVLGLGSALCAPVGAGCSTTTPTTPFPEDLFRYLATPGNRSFQATDASVFFSINGTSDLAQFHNHADGADYGDWETGSGPVRVQDAFATPGANPALSVELRALDVIGYDRVVVPEPGTVSLLGAALAVVAGVATQRRRKRN